MNFSEALVEIKNGKKVSREGWNGKRYPKIPEFLSIDISKRCEIHEDLVYFRLPTGEIAVCDYIDWIDKLDKREEWCLIGDSVSYSDYKSTQQNIPMQGLILGNSSNARQIDHINRNRLDNRRINLRFTTPSQNVTNSGPKNGKKYKGTTFDSERNKWIAAIQIDGKTRHLGRYENEEQAARAYDNMAFKVWGEFAYLNFPNEMIDDGMFVFLVPGSVFKVSRAPLLGIYPEGTEIKYHAHVDMKTADGQVVPWLCSQTDLLADDWGVVG